VLGESFHFLVTTPRLGGGAAALGEGEDAEDADRAAQGQRDDLAFAHLLGRFEHALAVDPDMALIDQGLGQGATLDQPDAVEIAVDPQRANA